MRSCDCVWSEMRGGGSCSRLEGASYVDAEPEHQHKPHQDPHHSRNRQQRDEQEKCCCAAEEQSTGEGQKEALDHDVPRADVMPPVSLCQAALRRDRSNVLQGGLHSCSAASWQAMQNRVHGTAASRFRLMSSLQSRQIPNVPVSMRRSAACTSRSRLDSRSRLPIANSRTVACWIRSSSSGLASTVRASRSPIPFS